MRRRCWPSCAPSDAIQQFSKASIFFSLSPIIFYDCARFRYSWYSIPSDPYRVDWPAFCICAVCPTQNTPWKRPYAWKVVRFRLDHSTAIRILRMLCQKRPRRLSMYETSFIYYMRFIEINCDFMPGTQLICTAKALSVTLQFVGNSKCETFLWDADKLNVL